GRGVRISRICPPLLRLVGRGHGPGPGASERRSLSALGACGPDRCPFWRAYTPCMVELGHAAKAMVLVEPRQLASTKIPSQPVDAGGWLAVEATAISGADVQAWHGERREVQYPLIPGHQVVGRIAVKDDTIPYEVGTRVVLEPTIKCGRCSRCRLGLATCQFRKPSNTYGLTPSTEPPALWGGMAEYLYIDPAATIHPVTDDVPAEVATSVHSLATGYTWAVELPNLKP